MIVHPSESRGYANHGWLRSHHTFSFAGYHNPERMNFGALRVLNDDSVEGGHGFGAHPHRDMEIISIPLEGALKHQDSQGNQGLIAKGEVQVMSAGTGIYHSEENASLNDPVKFLQIWVIPNKMGVTPRYGQKAFDFKNNSATLVVSPDAREGSLAIHQDAFFTMVNLDAGKELEYSLKVKGNGLYAFVIGGEVEMNGHKLQGRDAVGLEGLREIKVKAEAKSEVLLMEVPMKGF